MKRVNLSKENLTYLYLKKQQGIGCIAKQIGSNYSTVRINLIRFKIPIRSKQQANRLETHKINLSRVHTGQKVWNKGLTAKTDNRILAGIRHSRWQGGKRNVRGYIYVYSPEHPYKSKHNEVAEHRLVVEGQIGRYLTKEEIVHHLNGIRNDNRIENLAIKNNHNHERHTLEKLLNKRIRELERQIKNLKN